MGPGVISPIRGIGYGVHIRVATNIPASAEVFVAAILSGETPTPPEHHCAACGDVWPCKAALTIERDHWARIAWEREGLLLSHGIIDTAEAIHHPDSDSPLGRAIRACTDEALRQRGDHSRRLVGRHLSLILWHRRCNADCSGRNHVETLVLDGRVPEAACWEVAASLIRGSYGATLQGLTALDAEATRAALAQYESLSFKSQYNAGSGAIAFNPSTEGEWAGVRVRFTTDAPLETYRDFIQGYLDAETEREAREQDGRAEGAQGS